MVGFIISLAFIAAFVYGGYSIYAKGRLKDCTADYNQMCEKIVDQFDSKYDSCFVVEGECDIESVFFYLSTKQGELKLFIAQFDNLKTTLANKKNEADEPLYWKRTIKLIPDNRAVRDYMQQKVDVILQLVDEASATILNLSSLPRSHIIDMTTYGVPNHVYLNSLSEIPESSIVAYVNDTINALKEKRVTDILAIDFEELTKCMWHYAMKKPYSADDFTCVLYARELYYKKAPYEEVEIAKIYIAKQLSANNVLRDNINNIIKNCSAGYEVIASALMWLKDYEDERRILEAMLKKNIQMSPKLQERLKALSKGRNAVPIHEIQNNHKFVFDVSALSWKIEMYQGLFEDLAFQEKVLTYALAVRDENKELVLNSMTQVPEGQALLDKLKKYLSLEYGDAVTVKQTACIALSDSTEDEMAGTIISTSVCKYFALLLCIVPVGKKINIKFYSLFLPTANNVTQQEKEALSLFNQVSLTVATWESSMKQSVLVAIQQLLNEHTNENCTIESQSESSDRIEF